MLLKIHRILNFTANTTSSLYKALFMLRVSFLTRIAKHLVTLLHYNSQLVDKYNIRDKLSSAMFFKLL